MAAALPRAFRPEDADVVTRDFGVPVRRAAGQAFDPPVEALVDVVQEERDVGVSRGAGATYVLRVKRGRWSEATLRTDPVVEFGDHEDPARWTRVRLEGRAPGVVGVFEGWLASPIGP